MTANEHDSLSGLSTWELSPAGLTALDGAPRYEVPPERYDVCLVMDAQWVDSVGEPVLFALQLNDEVIQDFTQRATLAEYLFLKDDQVLELHLNQDAGHFLTVPNQLRGNPFSLLVGYDLQRLILVNASAWLYPEDESWTRLPYQARLRLAPGEARWYANSDGGTALTTPTVTPRQVTDFKQEYFLLLTRLESAARGEYSRR